LEGHDQILGAGDPHAALDPVPLEVRDLVRGAAGGRPDPEVLAALVEQRVVGPERLDVAHERDL
jgi:hypothetical protein